MTNEEWASDWRNHGEDKYLMNTTLIHAVYRENGCAHHEHCTFCWIRFSEAMSGDERSGYVCRKNGEDYWICTTCYNDLKSFFHWKVSE